MMWQSTKLSIVSINGPLVSDPVRPKQPPIGTPGPPQFQKAITKIPNRYLPSRHLYFVERGSKKSYLFTRWVMMFFLKEDFYGDHQMKNVENMAVIPRKI